MIYPMLLHYRLMETSKIVRHVTLEWNQLIMDHVDSALLIISLTAVIHVNHVLDQLHLKLALSTNGGITCLKTPASAVPVYWKVVSPGELLEVN